MEAVSKIGFKIEILRPILVKAVTAKFGEHAFPDSKGSSGKKGSPRSGTCQIQSLLCRCRGHFDLTCIILNRLIVCCRGANDSKRFTGEADLFWLHCPFGHNQPRGLYLNAGHFRWRGERGSVG
jgi:hypothetical protein